MAKRAQQESGEERVTAKSRPMMNLTAKMPSSCLLQLHQTRGGPRMKQDPGKSVASDDRTEKPLQPPQSDY